MNDGLITGLKYLKKAGNRSKVVIPYATTSYGEPIFKI
jgi:hypothetical protein